MEVPSGILELGEGSRQRTNSLFLELRKINRKMTHFKKLDVPDYEANTRGNSWRETVLFCLSPGSSYD